MDFNALSTQNWSRMFNVWIEDIQVIGLPAAISPFVLQHRFLPKVRVFARYTSAFVILLFALHCSSPRSTLAPPKTLGGPPGKPDDEGGIYTEQGEASWYGGDGDGFAGKITANGEVYTPSALTCAHRTLPFGTRIEVENLATGKRVIVRVNDRGPFSRGRILDLSRQGAHDLGILQSGFATVRLQTVDAKGHPAPVDPSVLLGNPFTIQVAALSNAANIERLSRELKVAFGPVTYQSTQGPAGTVVQRIRVGTYPRMEQAQKASEQLAKFCKDRGLESFIVRQN